MSGKVTLKDVAERAGVGPATVDRVINHRGGVNAAKEERVLRAARELGLDRRLDHTHRQTKRIVVMIQPPENPFHAELRKGIEAARKLVAALNIQVAIVQTRIDQPQETARRIRALPGYIGMPGL